MNRNITIREYREGDEASIMKLRGLVLSGSKDMDWWVWQHKQNPAGQATITVAETDKGKEIIGHSCILPLRMKIGNETCFVVTPTDIMVHPEYRGLKIGNQIRQRNISIAKQKNYLFTYSFPNLSMIPINQKRGVRLIFKKTPLWAKPLHLSNIVNRFYKRESMLTNLVIMVGKGLMKLTDQSRNYQIRTKVSEVKEIDERFDILWQQASSHHKIMLVRDRAYLNWRYVKKPDANYTIYISEDRDKLLGYIVLRTIEDNGLNIGWIVDMLTHSTDKMVSMDLVKKADQLFRTQRMDVILCVLPPKAYIIPSLKKHGFLMVSKWRKQTFTINYTVVVPKYHDFFITNPNNWYLTRGDSDLV